MRSLFLTLLFLIPNVAFSQGAARATIYDDRPITGTVTSDAFDIGHYDSYAIRADWAASDTADTFIAGTAGVHTATFEALADTVDKDFIVFYDTTGTKWGIALTKPLLDIQTLNFATFAATTSADFILITDTAGGTWAVNLDKTGATAAPTSPLYTAVAAANKSDCDVSTAVEDEEVAALVEACLDGLTDFDDVFVTDDTADDGTMTLTSVAQAPVTAVIVPKNASGAGAGSIATTHTQTGFASTAPTNAIAPWAAVPVANKSTCDISATTTDVEVAAAAELCIDALTGLSAVITTDDSAADGTMAFTQVVKQAVTIGVGYTPAGAVGGVTWALTTPAVASKVNLTTDAITVAAHGWFTGAKGVLTTTTTLPTGLSLLTDYFVIKVDANTLKLATTYALALAGTAIDITAEGVGTHTFTPNSTVTGTLKLQTSINGTDWGDVPSASQAISGAGSIVFSGADVAYRYLRTHAAMSTGQAVFNIEGIAK